MRILDRYLLREFVTYLAFGLIGFVAIYLVVDVFEKINVFLDHRAPLLLILKFYVNLTPEVIVQIFPVALLLATFLSLGQLNKFGELTAMRASGISIIRILLPVFSVAALVVVISLLLGEYVVPNSNRERDKIYDEQIQRLRRGTVTERADVTYLGEGGRIFYMRLYMVQEQRMHELALQEFKDGVLVRRIDAAEANWTDGRWVLTSGFDRTFADGRETAQPFERMSLDAIRERPRDFAKEARKPSEMNYFELRDYVVRLRASGARVANYLVDLHLKLAYPLINFIVVMIGASLATRLRMQGAAIGFGLSVAISFVYYAFVRTGQALGHNGALPPYAAAWLGDMVFGVIAIVMIAQAQRR